MSEKVPSGHEQWFSEYFPWLKHPARPTIYCPRHLVNAIQAPLKALMPLPSGVIHSPFQHHLMCSIMSKGWPQGWQRKGLIIAVESWTHRSWNGIQCKHFDCVRNNCRHSFLQQFVRSFKAVFPNVGGCKTLAVQKGDEMNHYSSNGIICPVISCLCCVHWSHKKEYKIWIGKRWKTIHSVLLNVCFCSAAMDRRMSKLTRWTRGNRMSLEAWSALRYVLTWSVVITSTFQINHFGANVCELVELLGGRRVHM